MRYLFLFLTIFFVLSIPNVRASDSDPTFVISETPNEVGLDEEFKVEIFVDTRGISINGIDALLKISDQFEVAEISENNSIIPLWVKRPKFESGVLNIAGIIPGGFKELIVPGEPVSTKGTVISLILRPKLAGKGTVKLASGIITLHDGDGTEITSDDIIKVVSILDVHKPKSLITEDVTSPDLFFPRLVKDPNVFDGDLTLFFETRDFESGIERYEVREDNGPFVQAQSPYRLRGQTHVAIITVRAIDRAGNDRTVELLTGLNKTPKMLGPVALVLVVLLLVLTLMHRKKRSQ